MKASLRNGALFMGVLLTLAACNKDDENPSNTPSISDPTSVASSVEISKMISDGDEEQLFTYDSEGRLSKVTESYSSEDEWGSYESTSEIVLTYTEGKLTKITDTYTSLSTNTDGSTSEGSSTETLVYTYNAKNQLEKAVATYTSEWGGSTYSDTETSTFEYDAEDRVVKQAYEEDGFVYEYVVFNWSGKNVAKEQWYYNSDEGARYNKEEAPLRKRRQALREKSVLGRLASKAAVLDGEYVYSAYDDKKNPLAILSLLYGYADGLFISANLPGKITNYEPDENGNMVEDDVTELSYEYDDKGRPTKITMKFLYDTEADMEVVSIVYKN